uniref:Putative secreted protein n=1 Tax=Anopheles darlingi TaxID=43151 RepID=A0A2M4DE56_ANODA
MGVRAFVFLLPVVFWPVPGFSGCCSLRRFLSVGWSVVDARLHIASSSSSYRGVDVNRRREPRDKSLWLTAVAA